jgi:hypothetical protein
MRFLSERMASLGCTVLDLMMSEISRLRAMSSLDAEEHKLVLGAVARARGGAGRSHRLLLVALSICSSRAVLAPDDHHPIILRGWIGDSERCWR